MIPNSYIKYTSAHGNSIFLGLKSVETDTLKILHEYFYTNKLELTEQNASKLLDAAKILKLGQMGSLCAKFIESSRPPLHTVAFAPYLILHI